MIPDGATLMIGGFMAVGTLERLMDELVRQGKRNLTIIANDTAKPGIWNRQAGRCRALSAGPSRVRSWRHIAAPDVCDGTSAVGESRHRIPRCVRWSTDSTLLSSIGLSDADSHHACATITA
jgi:hypothetical protein